MSDLNTVLALPHIEHLHVLIILESLLVQLQVFLGVDTQLLLLELLSGLAAQEVDPPAQ